MAEYVRGVARLDLCIAYVRDTPWRKKKKKKKKRGWMFDRGAYSSLKSRKGGAGGVAMTQLGKKIDENSGRRPATGGRGGGVRNILLGFDRTCCESCYSF